MNEPKIAIFMSCYNHEPYVGEAINSVIQQTYENWELYVANDGSTDTTEGMQMIDELNKVCDKFKVAGTFAPHFEI